MHDDKNITINYSGYLEITHTFCKVHQWSTGAIVTPQDRHCDECDLPPWNTVCDEEGRCRCPSSVNLFGPLKCTDATRSARLENGK